MRNKPLILKSIITLFTIFIVLFNFGCPASETIDENSLVEVRITEKKFSRSICSDSVTEALSIELRTILQNTSEVSGTIDDWKIEFYSDNVSLFSVEKSNYESFACGDQAVDISDKIEASGFFTFYGFVPISLFNNIIPNKATVTMTIKDDSGHTYQISDTF